jgi:hypothetical protein
MGEHWERVPEAHFDVDIKRRHCLVSMAPCPDPTRRLLPTVEQGQGAIISLPASATAVQGRGDDPTKSVFFRHRAIEPIAAGSSFIDKDYVLALRQEPSNQCVDVALSHGNGAKVDDFGMVLLGNVTPAMDSLWTSNPRKSMLNWDMADPQVRVHAVACCGPGLWQAHPRGN